MASFGELKAILAEIVQKSGEAYQALESQKPQVGAAIEVTYQTAQSAGVVFDGTSRQEALTAAAMLANAEGCERAAYAKIEEAQDALLAAQNAAEVLMGSLG